MLKIILFLSLNFGLRADSVESLEDVLSKLAERVNSFQVLKPHNSSPPFNWYKKKGLFRSDIRLNFFGNPVLQSLRNGESKVFDNDMFSSAWIVTVLLEANLYGKGAPVFESSRLDLTLNAIQDFRNRNDENSKQTLIRNFWQQKLNETSGLWYQEPTNIRNVGKILIDSLGIIPWKLIENVLGKFNLERLKKIVEFSEQGVVELRKLLDVFCIPPDFDDTYLNLGLGAILSKLKSQYPDIYANWLENNSNIDHLVDVTVKYAYEPFSHDLNKNIIDPRTYFYARHFIKEAYQEGNPLSLITTWVQNIDEQRKFIESSQLIIMPFNLNNVDVTVAANFIYGATSASIYNINDYGDYLIKSDDLKRIYLNTTKFISWAIKSNFSSRPDLAQLYYPSRYNFLWYASRSLFLLENELPNIESDTDKKFAQHLNSIYDILAEAKFYLQDAFENTVTDYLLKSYIKDKSGGTYFCDFLGQNDKDEFFRPQKNKDDCLFSTAQAINIFISTWTKQDAQTKKLLWKSSTPIQVKNLMATSVNWLQVNILTNKYQKLNAFFSGSVKGYSDLPYWYPANYLKFLNGSNIDPKSSHLEDALIGVKGVIDEETYEKMLKQKHFNVLTPIDFKGYNVEIGFPFWSSEPYTYAVSLLALSQYNNLIS